MSLPFSALLSVHTALSLIALAAGALGVVALFTPTIPKIWTTLFLAIASLVTITGFFFPLEAVTPAFVTGIVSTLILLGTFTAHYVGRHKGHWRWIYASGVVASLYLMVFVTVAQLFIKTPGLQPSGPAFGLTQLCVLAIFVFMGIKATKKFVPITA